MAEYGLTPNGPEIKRLDVILNEIHTELSEKWGVNTRQNPESLLNHLLTNFADQIADLWEFGEELYYSKYPSSAEGISLDNAAQYGGCTREAAAKSYYLIHCTGIDGTVLTPGTLIASNTNPSTQLSIVEQKTITRQSFNSAKVRIISVSADSPYAVALNGNVYSYSPTLSDSEQSIAEGISRAITSSEFTTTVESIGGRPAVSIAAKDVSSNNVLILSENLTTDSVTSIVNFGTIETGDIFLPDGVITKIVKSIAGLKSVINRCGYVAGRDEETDTEFRKSYADKIFNRSTMMLESIRSAILDKVQGVSSVSAYENPTNDYDSFGRPPHSIEIVVDGGDNQQIARQILDRKAGGICTFGDIEVMVPGEYDEDIPIRFNRPTRIYTWFHVGLTLNPSEPLPPNYAELLRSAILAQMGKVSAGQDVVPQKFMADLYKACSGMSYIDIRLFATDAPNKSPSQYPDRSENITARQRAYTNKSMIEVTIDG